MAKTLALVIGIVFLLVGALGLFPNSIVGEGALFHSNFGHNLVHLITGLIFVLVAAKSPSKSALTMKIFGVIYLIVAIIGFFVGEGQVLGFIANNGADNWLHLVLGLVILIAGLTAKDSSSSM